MKINNFFKNKSIEEKVSSIGVLIKPSESDFDSKQRSYKGLFSIQEHSYVKVQAKLKSETSKQAPTEEDLNLRHSPKHKNGR